MIINFENGSSIESLETTGDNHHRGKQTKIKMYMDYWERCPDKFIEFVTGQKLSLWKKMWLKILRFKKGVL